MMKWILKLPRKTSFPLKLDTCLWQVVSMALGDLTTTKLRAGTLQRVASGSLLL